MVHNHAPCPLPVTAASTAPAVLPDVDTEAATDELTVKIGAVVVTFNPDRERLAQVVAAIAPQVGAVALVDNGSAIPPVLRIQDPLPVPLELYSLGDNYGIAAAQNIGIAWARQSGFTHVLLLDHDAVAAPGMVTALLEEMQQRAARGEKVAGVGPLIRDPRRVAPAPFFRLTGWGLRRLDAPDPAENSARTDFLISAGALLSLAALDAIGAMDEALFIDYVDLEWSLRARRHGYRLYGHFGTTLDHRLGDEPLRLFGRAMTTHGPLRHYYLVRNAITLWRLPHTPWSWIIPDALHLLRKAFLLALLSPQRGAHMRMMLRGLCDGLAGRQGRVDQARRGWQVPPGVREIAPRRVG